MMARFGSRHTGVVVMRWWGTARAALCHQEFTISSSQPFEQVRRPDSRLRPCLVPFCFARKSDRETGWGKQGV